jgi:hypothetical protein
VIAKEAMPIDPPGKLLGGTPIACSKTHKKARVRKSTVRRKRSKSARVAKYTNIIY